jgi:hypothetical protein
MDPLNERGWTYQVVPEELHDEGGVLVALLGESVELCEIVSYYIAQIVLLSLPAMASSKACLANWQAWSGELRIS